MDSTQHKNSLLVLEGAIVHFLQIGQFGIVAELCELLLECDEIASKPDDSSSNCETNMETRSETGPETLTKGFH